MERSVKRNGLINLLALLVAVVAGFAVARESNSLAGQVCVLFLAVGVLVAAVSWFQMRLEESERLEKLELEELAKSHGTATLFEAKEAEAFPAHRAREQFERFFVPGFTALLCLVQAGGAYFLWRWLAQSTTGTALKEPMREPTVALALFSLFALVLFLLGKFSVTIARLGEHRLLRPGSSYLLLSAYLCFVVALGIAGVQAGLAKADFYAAHVLCTLLALIALESLVNLVLEMYRPRVSGKIERPVYESRLVGLLGQPEGLITTAAQAMDYQFGFKVSETWFYRFFEERILLLALLQAGALVLSTAVVFIETGEQALLERFGRPVEGRHLLGPGAHLKWPWPIDKVYRQSTEQIQSFNIGFTNDPARENDPVILWTIPHTKEENFLVANRVQASLENTNAAGNKHTPPVSLLTVSIPVQYQITNLVAWAYTNEDSPALLQDLATREVVHYLASADMNDIMSQGRLEAANVLRREIQAAADQRQLGAKIVFIGLQDIHPPVKVAPDYEKVVGAVHTRQAKILGARADDIRTNALAQAQATNILNKANAYTTEKTITALAQAARFTNQIPAYAAAPKVYVRRSYLQTFARATAGADKYVLLVTNTEDVLQLDLTRQIRADLLGAGLTPTPAKTNK